MAGGGSHASGEVSYHPQILEKFNATWNIVSDNVAKAGVYGVDFISGDGNLRPGYATLNIDPENWYGAITTNGLSATALRTYTQLNPDTIFNGLSSQTIDSYRISQLRGWLDSLWAEIGDDEGTDDTKAALVSAFAKRLSDQIDRDVIPKLEVGMRDTNAVLSSSILLSKAAIWDGYNREVDDYSAKVDFEILGRKYSLIESLAKMEPSFMQILSQSYDLALRRTAMNLDHAKLSMATTLSLNDAWWEKYLKSRTIYIEDQIRDAQWYNEQLNYLNQALAALPGGMVTKIDKGINAAMSATSGALAGAASGAMMGTAMGGPGWGTAIGAVVGGVAGYLSAQ